MGTAHRTGGFVSVAGTGHGAEPSLLPQRLTLILALLRPPGSWMLRPAVLCLAAVGLLWPRAARSPWLWAALAATAASRLVLDWPLADNHQYLLALWYVALALAASAVDPAHSLRTSARAMLAVVFTLAVLWKGVLSPDYLDGTFFRVALLSDARFQDLAIGLGGLDPAAYDANLALWDEAIRIGRPWPPGAVTETAALRILALFLTVWTLALEAALALVLLWPNGRAAARLRHPLLLVFILTTFSLTPVAGFGWLLAALGAALCGPEERRWQVLYAGAFLAVAIFEGWPWASWLRDALG